MDARTGGHGMEGTGRVAVVSGANRGIGLEVARQLARRGLTVVLGAWDLAKGEEAARRLRADGLTVLPRTRLPQPAMTRPPTSTWQSRRRHAGTQM